MPHVLESTPSDPPRAGAGTITRARRAALGAALVLIAGGADADLGERTSGAQRSDGVRVVEGDILVGPRLTRRGVGLGGAALRWPNGELPYRIDPALGRGAVRAVGLAIERWNEVSGVTLVAIAAGEPAPSDHVVFEPGPGCASWVGRQGGTQAVWVGPACSSGSIMHEIGHAIGLEHEHTRSDRDEHVRVLWDNIRPEKRHNFALAPSDARLLGAYDIESIMHYGPSNFSVGGEPTLEPIEPLEQGSRLAMGQRETPSAGDIAAVARLYASDLSLEMRVDDESAAREVTLFVTNEHPQGAHELSLTLEAEGLDVVSQSDDGWSCTAAAASAECHLERLEGEATSRVTLALGHPLPVTALVSEVRSKTPDLDLSDNHGQDPSADSPQLTRAGPLADSLVAALDDVRSEALGGGAGAGGGAPALPLLGLLAIGLVRRRAAATR